MVTPVKQVWAPTDCHAPSAMLELHIWGPGLGLPSIDAECLATIYYLRHTLPADSWVLIPSSNPYDNPFQRLPALRNDEVWTAGFDGIRQYLSDLSDGAWDIDHDLNETQIADCDAYTSFLYSRGLPLLDLSLYVSSENYTSCTRVALGELLSWPQSWTTPHQLREQAMKRSEHLGLSALDVDAVQEEDREDTGFAAHIPKSLRKPKMTVSGLLGRGTQRSRFRLDAVVEDCLEPLQSKLSGKSWLIAGHMSSADCLAIAILSLMQTPVLPQAWLHDALTNKYSRLSQWAKDQIIEAFDDVVSISSIRKGDQPRTFLPWQAPVPSSWIDTTMIAVEVVVSSVPLLKIGYQRQEAPTTKPKLEAQPGQKQQMYSALRYRQRLYSQAVTICVGATSVLGWMAHAGLVGLPHLQKLGPARRNFGEAGALLGL